MTVWYAGWNSDSHLHRWWDHSRPKHAEIDKYTKNKLCTKLVLYTRLYSDAGQQTIKFRLYSLNCWIILLCIIILSLINNSYFWSTEKCITIRWFGATLVRSDVLYCHYISLIDRLFLYNCLQRLWPTQTPDFTSSKSQVQFLVCESFHRICPSLRTCVIFCNMLVSYGEKVALPSV